ncbi:protein of unknown function [Azospirillum baldaniorum]|uniref:Uncharacterized protein n=1 Tax=Azospirillum baldaniorum TaxID=1064539 RepID=A0A9P1JSC3_9PROT|nr:protein of unknown function [Azospirillum baldaniorum]
MDLRHGQPRLGLVPRPETAKLLKDLGKLWCRLQGSNPRPSVYKTAALPTELNRRAARPDRGGRLH